MLQVLDMQWKDHLLALDHLKEGIGLRGYGQRDPLIEYKKESFDMFEALNSRREEETIRFLFPLRADQPGGTARRASGSSEEARRRKAQEQNLVYSAGGDGSVSPAQAGSRQGRPERSLSLRQRQEVQEMSRQVMCNHGRVHGFIAGRYDAESGLSCDPDRALEFDARSELRMSMNPDSERCHGSRSEFQRSAHL